MTPNEETQMVDEQRTETLEIELSEDEYRKVLKLVEEQGVPVEDWIRNLLLQAAELAWDHEDDDPDED